MPGRMFLTRPLADVAAYLGADGPLPNDPPRNNIAPGQEILTYRGGALEPMRWGIIPVGRVNARGRPVMETIINARSETVFDKSAFAGVRRCVVPVDGWYEWTGQTRRKTAWRITPKDEQPLIFAAIFDVWQGPGGVEVSQVATLTCEPSGDVRDVHHRMGVLLRPEDVDLWLSGTEADLTPLMVPLRDGSLNVEHAIGVDWDGI